MRKIQNKILLLNSDYRVLRFVDWSRALKLLLKNKVDIIDFWEGVEIRTVDGSIVLPATIRLRNQVRFHRAKIKFSKNLIKRRDNYKCQYCGKIEDRKKLTIDHVVPVSKGGESSFVNCVTACYKCNNKKNNSLLSETNMRLRKKPMRPLYSIHFGLNANSEHHKNWRIFLK
jgi:5-methylcytosine-specific restriction endonuclease McrA